MSHLDQLKVLNLVPLELRLELRFRPYMLFKKIVHGIVDVSFSDLFEYCKLRGKQPAQEAIHSN